jgi:2-keto-3-deoxy-galactonokinase
MLDPEPSDEMLVTLAAYGLTSSLSFQARSSILRSLLELDESKGAKEAKALIGTIVKEANRNAIIHGQVFVAGSHHLRFIYRKTDDSLSAKCIEVDCDSMQKRASTLRQNIIRLQELLSVPDDLLHEFGRISQMLAIKSAMSPRPPNSKNS